MERVLQYLDDLEDLFYAVALLRERIRRLTRIFLVISALIAFQGLAILLALSSPPVAVAASSLLLVGTLYRGVVHNAPLASPTT